MEYKLVGKLVYNNKFYFVQVSLEYEIGRIVEIDANELDDDDFISKAIKEFKN